MARLLARAIENNKPNHFFQIGEATPFCQLADVIFADQAVNRCITFELSNLLDCIDGIGRWRAPQFAIVHGKSRFLFNRGLNHQQPYFVSRNRRGLSKRRYPSGNKDYFVSAEFLKRLACNDKMAVMNRIKCAAVDCDFFQRSMLNARPAFGKSTARQALNIQSSILSC